MRRDYYRDLWTYVAPERGRRKIETSERPAPVNDTESCDFCPGHEDRTPPEKARYRKNSGWQVRVFGNKYPIVSTGSLDADAASDAWPSEQSYGIQEVIVDTPRHDEDVPDLPTADLVTLLEVYRDRIAAIEQDSKIAWVQIFKNYGFTGGASLRHPHSQLVATAHLPPPVAVKLEHTRSGSCAYCRIYKLERQGPRFVFENDSFAALVPLAPREEFEAWIISRLHLASLSSLDQKGLADLAQILKLVVGRASQISGSYNYMLFYGPRGRDFHLHLEVVPRLEHVVKAGFELATGFAVMTRTPESMAAFYRAGIERQNGVP